MSRAGGAPEVTPRKIAVPGLGEEISAILMEPAQTRGLYVLAHGAGAGMQHPFMDAVAVRLAGHGIATLRYNFIYMEKRKGSPDREPVLLATVRAAVEAGVAAANGVPVIAGGKSMGGRMTSRAAAEEPLAGVSGLAFLGFPLHPPGQPGISRAEHLDRVRVPMLFLEGTRDTFADLDLLRPAIARLGDRATLHIEEGADHSFHVQKRSGRDDAQVLDALAQAIAGWLPGAA